MKSLGHFLEKKDETKKTVVKSTDDSLSSDLLNLNDYGLQTTEKKRYILDVQDNHSIYG